MPLESINLSASGKKSDFKPTEQEMNTIKEKMKDPEFMKLMTEYMESLSDPKYRQEEEEYLAQVEREAKEGGDHSFDFIFPKPAYFVELLQGVGKDREGSRVFINMCTSEKIEEYKEETTNSREASNWIVPVSIGRPRPDTFEGKPVCVYDAAFHPKTIAIGERSDRFMTFLVEIAVENINSGHKKSYGYGYRRMSSSTSKVQSVGQPANMTVKREKGEKSIFDVAKEQSVLSAPTRFSKDGEVTLREAAVATSAATSSSSHTNAKKSQPSPQSSAKVATQSKQDNLPEYTITHRGVVDLTDTWNWKVSDKRTGVPKQLVVTITFAGVTSAAALELDVSSDGSCIDIHKNPEKHPFFGSIVLPFTVEETPSSAKFDKKKSILTLVLEVKNTIIPQDQLPNKGTTPEAEAASEPNAVPPIENKNEGIPIDVQSAAPSASPMRSELPPQISGKAKGEANLTNSTESTATHASIPAPTPAPATEGFEADAGDRMKEVMRKIAEAKKEREEAERVEREAEQAVKDAEAAEAKKQTEPETSNSAPLKEQTTEEAVANGVSDPTTTEEPLEVVDLRNRQAEWLKGVSTASASNDMDAAGSSDKKVSFDTAIKQATGGLLDDEEEDAEAVAKRKEMKRKLKELQRQEDAAKEAERLDSIMKEKMAALPLRSKYILDIE